MRIDRIKSLEKIAFGGLSSGMVHYPTVGISNPGPTVGDVLSAIGVAQANGIGTQAERRDAFGRIVNSGLVNSSPARTALGMLGGGILGRAITGVFTNNPLIKGIGAGVGALARLR